MKSSKIISGLTAVALTLGSFAAIAQPRDDRRDDRRGHDDRGSVYHGPQGPHGRPGPVMHRPGPPPVAHYDGRGAGPDHNFRRGGRLPPQYRSPQYVVNDWRGHHLSAPPRGYHWVQTGGDYVLAAIATGVIASILLNN
jgi:Ni/Co efflux regulator RcnB